MTYERDAVLDACLSRLDEQLAKVTEHLESDRLLALAWLSAARATVATLRVRDFEAKPIRKLTLVAKREGQQ